MQKIADKDLLLGILFYYEIDTCYDVVPVLFSSKTVTCKKPCDFLLMHEKTCEVLSCPIPRLKDELLDKSPCFLNVLKKIYLRVPVNQKESFLTLSLTGIVILFSSNNAKVPIMSPRFMRKYPRWRPEGIIDDMSEWEIRKKLSRLNNFWMDILYEESVRLNINTGVWRKILALLEIFIEGMQPIEALSQTDKADLNRAVLDFLRTKRRAKT
jgi:hypothetical protein